MKIKISIGISLIQVEVEEMNWKNMMSFFLISEFGNAWMIFNGPLG